MRVKSKQEMSLSNDLLHRLNNIYRKSTILQKAVDHINLKIIYTVIHATNMLHATYLKMVSLIYFIVSEINILIKFR